MTKMPLPLSFKYDFVLPIGHFCATAMYLKRWHIRTMSLPFDWIGREPNGLAVAARLICDGFRGFLEKSALEPRPNRHRPDVDDRETDYYLDRGTGMLVYHDFPTGVPLDESYPAVRAKYDRRIARMYRLLEAAKSVLLVYHTPMEHPSDEEMAQQLAKVRARFADKRIGLLVIEEKAGLDDVEVRNPSDGVCHVRCCLYARTKDRVMGELAVGDRVYSMIRCRGVWWNRLRPRLFRAWGNFVSAFCVGREARHRLREKFRQRHHLGE